MSNTWKTVLIAAVSAVSAVALLSLGFIVGRSSVLDGVGGRYLGQPEGWRMDPGLMGPGGMMGYGGMHGYWQPGAATEAGQWRGGWMHDRLGRRGQPMGGMMGWPQGELTENLEPLGVDQADAAASEYLSQYGYGELEIGEIMVFDNHAYVQAIEPDTDLGAMELQVDPVSGEAYPEHGPNMMWNLKYGTMAGRGGMMGMRGMMGGSQITEFDDFETDVSPTEAVDLAQTYLDRIGSSLTADDHAVAFYGYYTIHTLEDGEVSGMLSVHGFTGEVFPHTWHGTLVTMSEH